VRPLYAASLLRRWAALHAVRSLLASVKQRRIASKGGKAAHEKGAAHEWTPEEARAAGRKGGVASHRRQPSTPLSDEKQD